MTDLGDLSGRRVLITGAGRGLGREMAVVLAAAGATIHAADIDARRVESLVAELADSGHVAHHHQVDIADEDSVAAMVGAAAGAATETGDDGRPLWGLVNSAALADAVGGKYFWELDRNEWDRLLGVNLTGTWLVTKHVAPHLIAAGAGRVVNLASDSALYGSPRLSHYIASKGGIIALTRAMARELGPHGITVNAVAPGIVATESTRDVPAARHQLYADNRALARPQEPGDVAGVVQFLLSDAAAYITGTTQVVDGGFVMP